MTTRRPSSTPNAERCPVGGIARATFAAMLLGLSLGVNASPIYHVTPIAALAGYEYSVPQAVNDVGQVAGYSTTSSVTNFTNQGFVFSTNVLNGIGFLPGDNNSQAFGINNLGVLVGQSSHVFGAPLFSTTDRATAVSFTNGTLTNLGTFGGLPYTLDPQTAAEASYSVAYGINDNGQAVGLGNANGTTQALLFNAGSVSIIGGLPNSGAVAINSAGIVAGNWVVGQSVGFVSSGGGTTNLEMLPGSNGSTAQGINDSGQIVGYGWVNGSPRAWLVDGGTVIGLGTLTPGTPGANSVARGINNAGQIVGYSHGDVNGINGQHAFLYDAGQMVAIDTLLSLVDAGLYQVLIATDINNSGWIVGTALNLATGLFEGVLLTPENQNPVHEPGSLTLVGAALAALLGTLRRKG